MKVQRKQGLVSSSDSNNKHSPNNKRSLVPSPVAHRPLRDRIIHLLALKPYRKPELLLWLDRERATPKDKADLTSVLEEVRYLVKCYVNTLPTNEKFPQMQQVKKKIQVNTNQAAFFPIMLKTDHANINKSPTCNLLVNYYLYTRYN